MQYKLKGYIIKPIQDWTVEDILEYEKDNEWRNEPDE